MKRYTKKKGKSPVAQIEDSDDSATGPSLKCKFCEKERGPNECWHLRAECYHCHDVGHIAKFCKKKSSLRTSLPKDLATCNRRISFCVDQSSYTPPASCIVTSEHYESNVKKVTIDSGATDHFLQIGHIGLRTKNIIMSSKLVPGKFSQHMGTGMLCYVWHIQTVQK